MNKISKIVLVTVLTISLAIVSTADPNTKNLEPQIPDPLHQSAIIDNGLIQMGINDQGHLNIYGGTPSSGTRTTAIGLRYMPTNAEATAPGCLCEGWGVADAMTGIAGFADVSVDGVQNMEIVNFTNTSSEATSIVDIPNSTSPKLRVKHYYHPSVTQNLYQVNVSITNIGTDPVDMRYRRVMDWDVEPTAFSEYVTINPGTSSNLIFDSNNGFASANPLSGPTNLGYTGAFTDVGPMDHGALFDFDFGILAPGEKKEFVIFYGAAATEVEANAALVAVGAEAYSIAQPNTPNGPTLGTPNTFIFAFNNVGGAPIIPPTPAPQPVAEAGGPYTVYEGVPVTINASGSYDPSGGVLTYAWDFNGDGIYEIPGFEVTRTPRDGPRTRIIGLQVKNGKGGVGTDTATWNVKNVPPRVNAGPDQVINEGDTANFAASFSDVQPDMNVSTAQINYGDGIIENVTANPNGTIEGSHTYADNGIYTVTVTVTDKDGGIGSDTAIVTVNNVVPIIDSLSTDSYIAQVDTMITGTGTFHDPGTLDTFTADWNWEDSTNALNLPAGSTSTTYSHTYTTPGVYTVGLKITDKDGGSDTENMPQYIVIYDASGGFVTGGGWIDSPAGAYVTDPSLTGNANFGFVSKYQKGANTPTGQTEFQFHAGDLNFHSTSYDWLVVAGAKAQYKGVGTINGAGNYGFLLTATDGQVNGGGGVDKFRIKIVDKTTNSVVYDNIIGASEDIDAANPQAIAGGSIVIHK